MYKNFSGHIIIFFCVANICIWGGGGLFFCVANIWIFGGGVHSLPISLTEVDQRDCSVQASIPKVVGSNPTVTRHVFLARPVWIYTQSNTTNIIYVFQIHFLMS